MNLHKMVDYKDVLSSLTSRAPKLQLAVEKPSTGGCWNPPKKDTPPSKDKEEAAARW